MLEEDADEPISPGPYERERPVRAMRERPLAVLTQRVRMIHVITVIFLVASLWIILSNKYDDDVLKWAFGAMGSILGFWLAPAR